MQTATEKQAQTASSDAAILDRCKHVKIHFMTGDIQKLLLGRSKYGGMFPAITLGHRHVHLLEKQHALAGVAAPGALLAVETVKYMLQLTSKQVGGLALHASGYIRSFVGWRAMLGGPGAQLRTLGFV